MDRGSEEWRAVIGHEGWYEVSDLGRVRRIKPGKGTRGVGLVLSPRRHTSGYAVVTLQRGTRASGVRAYVHRLVAQAFIGPIDDDKLINHLDGNPWNNQIANLEITTQTGNMLHASDTGLLPRGVRHWKARLTPEDVREIRRLASGVTRVTLAKRFRVSEAAIRDVVARRNWKHIP